MARKSKGNKVSYAVSPGSNHIASRSSVREASTKSLIHQHKASLAATKFYDCLLETAMYAWEQGEYGISDSLSYEILSKENVHPMLRVWSHLLIAMGCEDPHLDYHASRAIFYLDKVIKANPGNNLYEKHRRMAKKVLGVIREEAKGLDGQDGWKMWMAYDD